MPSCTCTGNMACEDTKQTTLAAHEENMLAAKHTGRLCRPVQGLTTVAVPAPVTESDTERTDTGILQ